MEHAVFYWFHAERDPRPILENLLLLGADINACPDGTAALLIAVWQCNSEVTEWLILHRADINAILDDDGVKWTALDYAYMDQQVRGDNDGFHTKEDYQRLIDMLERQGAKLAQDLSSQPYMCRGLSATDFHCKTESELNLVSSRKVRS